MSDSEQLPQAIAPAATMNPQDITKLGDKAAQIGHLLAPFSGAERELILKMVPYCRNCGQPNPGGNECDGCFDHSFPGPY